MQIEHMRDEVIKKSNIKDVCALVDMKVDSSHLERCIDEIYLAIQTKETPSDSRKQAILNENFTALNCTAKWVWHGGFTSTSFNSPLNQSRLSSKSKFERGQFKLNPDITPSSLQDYVRWSSELVNTNPDHFEMSEDDCGSLLVHNAGVYEISFTFFVPPDIHKPSVQLRLNNKPILSTIDSQR